MLPQNFNKFTEQTMRKQELGSLKHQAKRLTAIQFRPLKRGGLPRPLDKIGGKRLLVVVKYFRTHQ